MGSKHLHVKKGSLSTIVFTQIVVLLYDARELKKFFKPSFDSVCVMQLSGFWLVWLVCKQFSAFVHKERGSGVQWDSLQ